MREILYVQAGNISNHIGSHFWNTEETYFSYDGASEETDDGVVNHDTSFREGVSWKGESTYCPRLLLFDRRENFGALGKYNDLYPDTHEARFQGSSWAGAVAEHKQTTIPKSEYLTRLDEGEESEVDESVVPTFKPKYWSDFNRMYYVPRSVHPVPPLANLGIEESGNPWTTGREVFHRYDMENSVIEQDMRAFLEECDNFQGFQVMFDNESFGGFTSSLLESIRDELPKHPILSFSVLSGLDPSSSELDENIAMRNAVLQDTLCLRMLQEHGTQNVPLQDPSTWSSKDWSTGLSFETKGLYETSAVLSAHIETATLPLRYKRSPEDLADYCAHLNWTQSTKISQLSGVLPYNATGNDVDGVARCYSSLGATRVNVNQRSSNRTFAQKHVSRGLLSLPTKQLEKFDENLAKTSGLASPYLSSTHAPAYPLPTSFPRYIFRSRDGAAYPDKTLKTARGLPAVRMTSSISTGGFGAADLLKAHAQFAERCAKMHLDVGVEADELRELGIELWTAYDGYGAENVDSEEELGEDEEF